MASCVLVITAVLVLVLPVNADEAPLVTQSSVPRILITEVQTGSAASGSDEFIELFNAGELPVDITGWQVRYITASPESAANLDKPTKTVILTGGTLPAKGYALLYAGAVGLPEGVTGQSFAAGLPAAGGSLVLLSPDTAQCQLAIEDAFAWGEARVFGEGTAAMGATAGTDAVFMRLPDAAGYADTNVNAADFVGLDAAAMPNPATPAAANSQPSTPAPVAGGGATSIPLPTHITDTRCTIPEPEPTPASPPVSSPLPPSAPPPATVAPPETSDDQSDTPVFPARNIGLVAPHISELLPNPAAPALDANDEFIELYNSNGVPFDLSGFMLEVGLTTKRRYIFADGSSLAPKAFKAFFSRQTNLTLANTQGQVRLLDPAGAVIAEAHPYTAAKDNQAWVQAASGWQWTTAPTPDATNIIKAPPVKAKKTTNTTSSKAAKSAAGTVQGATGSSDKASATESNQQAPNAATGAARSSLHPVILALVAGFALLYGAYEYRHDVANKVRQLRSNRAARAQARQSTKGR